MKSFVRYSNFVLFFALLSALLYFKPYDKLSTKLLSLLPQNSETNMLYIYENFSSSNDVLVAIKGDIKKLHEIDKKILSHSFIESKKLPFINQKFKEFTKRYSYFMQEFDETNLKNIDFELEKAYKNLISNPFYMQIDKKDPLNLFSQRSQKSNIDIKNGQLYIKDFGYMKIYEVKNASKAQVYTAFAPLFSEDIKVFSPSFYFVENSKIIKDDVNILIYTAVGILLLMYIFILKDPMLLTQTMMTLANSSILALFVVTSVWDEISVC